MLFTELQRLPNWEPPLAKPALTAASPVNIYQMDYLFDITQRAPSMRDSSLCQLCSQDENHLWLGNLHLPGWGSLSQMLGVKGNLGDGWIVLSNKSDSDTVLWSFRCIEWVLCFNATPLFFFFPFLISFSVWWATESLYLSISTWERNFQIKFRLTGLFLLEVCFVCVWDMISKH